MACMVVLALAGCAQSRPTATAPATVTVEVSNEGSATVGSLAIGSEETTWVRVPAVAPGHQVKVVLPAAETTGWLELKDGVGRRWEIGSEAARKPVRIRLLDDEVRGFPFVVLAGGTHLPRSPAQADAYDSSAFAVTNAGTRPTPALRIGQVGGASFAVPALAPGAQTRVAPLSGLISAAPLSIGVAGGPRTAITLSPAAVGVVTPGRWQRNDISRITLIVEIGKLEGGRMVGRYRVDHAYRSEPTPWRAFGTPAP